MTEADIFIEFNYTLLELISLAIFHSRSFCLKEIILKICLGNFILQVRPIVSYCKLEKGELNWLCAGL